MATVDVTGSDPRRGEGAPAALIAADRACVHCGYNLRGLTAESLCPECGGTVSESLANDHLIHADPAWLRLLHVGMILLIAASILRLGGWLLARRFPGLAVLPAVHPGLSCLWTLGESGAARNLFRGREMLSPLLIMLATVVQVVGIRFLGSPPKGLAARYTRWRVPLLCAGTATAGVLFMICATFWVDDDAASAFWDDGWGRVVAAAVDVALAGVMWSYLAQLAAPVRGGRLARLARLVRWTTVLAGGVLTGVVVLEAERRQPGPMLLVAVTYAALTASLVVMTAAGVLALGVLAAFAVAVRRMAAGPAS